MRTRILTIAVCAALLLFGASPSSFGADIEDMKEYELRSAAAIGDTFAVQKLLSTGVNVNGTSKRGYTALIIAARANHTEVVKLLVAKNADVNARDEDGDSALMQAVQNGNREVVETLLKYNADINIRDNKGNTPLMKAVMLGKSDIVRILLNNKADINSTNENVFSALMIASRNGNTDIVRMLLLESADISIRSPFGETALSLATNAGHAEIISLLKAKGPHNQTAVSSPAQSPAGGAAAAAAADSAAKTAATGTGAAFVPNSAMRIAAERWLVEAETELSSANLLLDREKYRGAGQHYKLAVAYGMQALILQKGQQPAKTRDIVELLTMVQKLDWQVSLTQEEATILNNINIPTYPTSETLLPLNDPPRMDVNRSAKATERFMESVRRFLSRR